MNFFSSKWIRTPNFTNLAFQDYDAYWEHRGWSLNKALKKRERVILDIIPPNAKVIDLGCGNSLLPVKLKEKGCAIQIGDISEVVLKGYNQHGISGKVIDLENIEQLVLAEQYDYIILSEVLEHLRYPEKVLEVLRKNTDRFIITIPNTAAYHYRYCLAIKGRFPTQWTYHPSEHLRYWSHLDFLDWLKAMDIVVEKSIAADGMTIRGLFPHLPNFRKNFFAHRVVYVGNSNKNL